MLISKRTPVNNIEILAQRYHDRRVLVASWKVGMHNRLTFQSNSMPGEFYISGEKIRQYPVKNMRTKSGGTAKMYVVPLDELEPLEYKEDVAQIAKTLFD